MFERRKLQAAHEEKLSFLSGVVISLSVNALYDLKSRLRYSWRSLIPFTDNTLILRYGYRQAKACCGLGKRLPTQAIATQQPTHMASASHRPVCQCSCSPDWTTVYGVGCMQFGHCRTRHATPTPWPWPTFVCWPMSFAKDINCGVIWSVLR